jgi:hypothetical protein
MMHPPAAAKRAAHARLGMAIKYSVPGIRAVLTARSTWRDIYLSVSLGLSIVCLFHYLNMDDEQSFHRSVFIIIGVVPFIALFASFVKHKLNNHDKAG